MYLKTLGLAAIAVLAITLLLPALPAAPTSVNAAPTVSTVPVGSLFAPGAALACSQDLANPEPSIGTVTQGAACNSNQCYLACVRKGYWAGYCISGNCVCQQNPSGLE